MEPHHVPCSGSSNDEGAERKYDDEDKAHEDPMRFGKVGDQRKVLEDDVWVYAGWELATRRHSTA